MGRCIGPGGLTWSKARNLATFQQLESFDCAFQNARWVVRRDDGVVAIAYRASDSLRVHLVEPGVGRVRTLTLEPRHDFPGLFGVETVPLGSSLRNAAIATDGRDFYIAAELHLAQRSSDIVVLRLRWSGMTPEWTLLARSSGLVGCGLPSIAWDPVTPEVLFVAFHARTRTSLVGETNIYVWMCGTSPGLHPGPELVDSAGRTGTQTRSKDMASVSATGGRVLLAWRTTLQGTAMGAPQYGVMAALRDQGGRLPWASVRRTTLAGLATEFTDASDPCALLLPDGTSLVSYWRQDPTPKSQHLPEIRVSSKAAGGARWTMSAPLAPASPASAVTRHFFCHLEHDDCRVIGIWEGRQFSRSSPRANGVYVSGSRGRAKWAVPTAAGYFEVPGTGQGPTTTTASNALYPAFCTGGGLLHLVWLEETTLTLHYATGVLK